MKSYLIRLVLTSITSWIALLLIIVATSISAFASQCDGIDRTLTVERKAALAPVITQQLARQIKDVESVEVLQSFHYQGWYIIYVDTHVSDDGFLVYKSDPTISSYVTVLAGAYPKDDEGNIRKSLQRGKAKGIPRALARCIAWHITNELNL